MRNLLFILGVLVVSSLATLYIPLTLADKGEQQYLAEHRPELAAGDETALKAIEEDAKQVHKETLIYASMVGLLITLALVLLVNYMLSRSVNSLYLYIALVPALFIVTLIKY